MGLFNIFRRREPTIEVYQLPPQTQSGANGSVSLLEPTLSDAGVHINETNALRISAVYSCVRLISETVATLPRHIYRRTDSGRAIDREHPIYRLVHDTPNDYMTAFELFESMVVHLCLYGNSYCYIDRDATGIPISIQPLLPDRTWPEKRHGNLVYLSRLNEGTMEFLPSDILHLKGLSIDGLVGLSPTRLLRNDYGHESAAGTFMGKFFGSGANMGGVLTFKGKLSTEARAKLKEQIQSEYQGNSNAFKLMVLEEDARFDKFGISPEDGQLNETRNLLIRKIASAFRVPPHKIGDTSRTSYSSLEQENRSFYSECINPYLRRIEDQINQKLFLEAEKGQTYFEFNRLGVLQADTATQTQHFHMMLQDGVYLRNEVRAYLGLNPIPGGDIPLKSANMVEGITSIQEDN